MRFVVPSTGANIGWPAGMTAGGAQIQAYYETLLHLDGKGNVVPWLAESYKVADDHKSITFTIRKGIKFSDGSDLTADVVKWNLDQFPTVALLGLPAGAPPAGAPSGTPTSGAPPAGAPAGTPPAGAPAGAPPAGASPVEVVDPYTVRVNITTWDNSIPASFADFSTPAYYMASKAAYDKNGKDWMITNPVGTGAFTVASFASDASMKLVKNPNYWATDAKGGKLPYLDGLDVTFTADRMTMLMMAKAGEADMVLATPGKDMADYKAIGWRTTATYDSNEVWVPDSAHQDSPWSKLEVREAAEYAVDRATIAQKFGYGYLQAPNQIPPRDTTAYNADYSLARNYDPAKAKQLLAQAGYPDGFKTTLIVWPGANQDIAIAEQQYLAQVGIKAEVQLPDMGKMNSYTGPQGSYHNALLEIPLPAQGPTGMGCVNFALAVFGDNWQKPPEFMQALGAATSAPALDVSLIRAITDVLAKNALLIPLYEIGNARVEQPSVNAQFGTKGLPAGVHIFETAWLNK